MVAPSSLPLADIVNAEEAEGAVVVTHESHLWAAAFKHSWVCGWQDLVFGWSADWGNQLYGGVRRQQLALTEPGALQTDDTTQP